MIISYCKIIISITFLQRWIFNLRITQRDCCTTLPTTHAQSIKSCELWTINLISNQTRLVSKHHFYLSCLVLSCLELSLCFLFFFLLTSFHSLSIRFFYSLRIIQLLIFFSIIFNNHCITEDMQERVLCMNMILYIYKKLLY